MISALKMGTECTNAKRGSTKCFRIPIFGAEVSIVLVEAMGYAKIKVMNAKPVGYQKTHRKTKEFDIFNSSDNHAYFIIHTYRYMVLMHTHYLQAT
jgi:hypothetical protein